MLKVGLFIPIGNNGWYVSETTPQYKPTFDLNREIVQRAEHYGLDFALAMIKLRGYGGKTEYWDYNLEAFTLISGIAAVTSRIQLFASVSLLTIPPAITARMAVTIDSVADGRFGVNIVTGWAKGEFDQMGLWPGDDYFTYRYDYADEYMTVMEELWTTGRSDFKGKYFQMNDCMLLPKPSKPMTIVSAGQSDRGMKFVADHCDYNFVMGTGFNTPEAVRPTVERLNKARGNNTRVKGALVLINIVAAETDEAAMRKWEHYAEGIDHEALRVLGGQSSADKNAAPDSTAGRITARAQEAPPTALATLCGSYETVARHLDTIADIPGVTGVMLTFDDFLIGMEQFGQFIQPLMKSRVETSFAAAAE